jgi:hypothetical protein
MGVSMSILEQRITTLADIRLAAIADRATIVIQA